MSTRVVKSPLTKRPLRSCEPPDLNGNHIQTLDQPPTALEFSRLIHITRPVIINGTHLDFRLDA